MKKKTVIYFFAIITSVALIAVFFSTSKTEYHNKATAVSSTLSKETNIQSKQTEKLPTNKLPNKILAGFMDVNGGVSTNQLDMTQIHKDGYNLVIVGNAKIVKNNVVFATGKKSGTLTRVAKSKIKQANAEGMPVLLSIGGYQKLFYNAANSNKIDPVELGNNIVKFLHKYKISGVVYSFNKFVSPRFILKMTRRIREIDPKIIISANPSVSSGILVTSEGNANYSSVIENGYIDYLFVKGYGYKKRTNQTKISNRYSTIVRLNKIPKTTKLLIEEPTSAEIGGSNSIYHIDDDATYSISTKEAIISLLPGLHKLKYKPRFVGVYGNSLNADYFPELFGDNDRNQGMFAISLKECVFNNKCGHVVPPISGHIVGGVINVDKNNLSDKKHNKDTTSVDMLINDNLDYCDKYPSICDLNMIFMSHVISEKEDGFIFDFNTKVDKEQVIYDKKSVKRFISYMIDSDKHVILYMGENYSSINWNDMDIQSLVDFIKYYGFDGINFDLDEKSIPKDSKTRNAVAAKIKTLIELLRQYKSNFILSFSPKWEYIVSPISKENDENIYNNDNYVYLIDEIGMHNINYVFLDTYSDGDEHSLYGSDKNGSKYEKVSDHNNYDKFISSLAWALTTKEGLDANKDKYIGDKSILIPASKLVFMVENVNGEKGISASRVDSIIELINKNGSAFNGFVLGGLDLKQMRLDAGEMFNADSNKNASLIRAIYSAEINSSSNLSLPVVKPSVKKETSRYVSISNDNFVDYPGLIGSYIYGMQVQYKGEQYECVANDGELCNNSSYLPGTAIGSHVWLKLKVVAADHASDHVEYPSIIYPKGIGSYKDGTVVFLDKHTFVCMDGQSYRCNDVKYSPVGANSFKAWDDITLSDKELIDAYSKADHDDSVYKYPLHIDRYIGGTQVVINGDTYSCRIGSESQLCSSLTYTPVGQYGHDAWIQLSDKLSGNEVSNGSSVSDEISYPDGIKKYAAGTQVESEGHIYMCKPGPISRLCKKESFSPVSSKGIRVWTKIT